MRPIRIVCAGVHLVLVLVSSAMAEQISRRPLDPLWEAAMLAGQRVVIVNERRLDVPTDQSFETSRGDPFLATLAKQGISVCDLRETRFLGLLRNGGWCLDGGLLGRVDRSTDALELYAKLVIRRYPYFFFPFHKDPKEQWSLEFFLLDRGKNRQEATVLRKWVISSDEIAIPQGFSRPEVRAYLGYDVAEAAVTVTITGLNRQFLERVSIAKMGQ